MQNDPAVPKWLVLIVQIPRTIIQTIFNGPLRPLHDWFTRQMFRLAIHRSAHETFDGINLYCVEDEENEIFFETVTKALKLLRDNDPRRYCRVRKHLKNIALFPTGNGHYQAATSSYMVDSFDPSRFESFADAIVHEATHGMLYHRGFKYEADKRRHETICIHEQFRTARRLIYRLNPELAVEKRNEMVEARKTWMETALRDEWWDPHKLQLRGLVRLMSLWHKETVPYKEVYVVVLEKDDNRQFLIRNATFCEVTVTIKLSGLENGSSDATSPWTKTIPPKAKTTAFTITALSPLEPLKYRYTWGWRYGSPDVIHDDSYLYGFPFDIKLLQEGLDGPPQKQDGSSRWYVPIGTAIRAARDGVVLAVSYPNQILMQIIIKHRDGTSGSYQGFAQISVKMGQEVKKGETLGVFGDKQTHGLLGTFHFYVWKPIDGESSTYIKVKFDTLEKASPPS